MAENIENEKFFLKYPFEINIQKSKIILKQLQKSVCKIYNSYSGSGFFCKISFIDKKHKDINALITCNHVLGKKDLIQGKSITFSFYDEKKTYSFILDEKRIFFTNVEYDITIIEIKAEDQIDYECLKIHENIFSNADIDSFFRNKPIYILHNPNNNTLVSYGIIKKIKKSTIDHCSTTQKGSSGGPILSLVDNKVIGIHKGFGRKEKDFNKGILISFGINEFEKYLDSLKNDNSKYNDEKMQIDQMNNYFDIKKNKEIEEFSHFSKETILEKEPKKKDYDLNSTITEISIIRSKTINKFQNKQGEEEFIIFNSDDLSNEGRISVGNINNKILEKNPFKFNLKTKNNDINVDNNFIQNSNNNYLKSNNKNTSNNNLNYNINKSYFNKINNPNYVINIRNIPDINNNTIYGEEQLFKDEFNRIIFRNGLLKGIIKNYSEIRNIVDRIELTLKKKVYFYIIYKATELDDKASTFHQMCDSLNISLVIIETNKGVRFGGFTTRSWDGNCLKKYDNNAFVFSIDKNKIYNIYKNELAVGGYPKCGPVFFGCQINIYDNFFRKESTTCKKGLNYSTTEDFELNNGERFYIVKDIEVYTINT